MGDNIAMTCEDVKKRLKSFQDDLLAEDEYHAFISHLNGCAKCKDYVSAIGSLSNQLWELGNVKVPSDFGSTVLFKLKQPEPELQTPKIVISKKVAVGILLLILASLTAFFGIKYFSVRGHPQETRVAPQAAPAAETGEEKPPRDSGKKILFKEVRIVAPDSESPGDKGTTKETSATGDSSYREGAIAHEPQSLHWHFLYSEEGERRRLSDAISILDIGPDYQTSDLLVFSANGDKIARLHEQLLSASRNISSLRDFTDGALTAADKKSRVSIYLENRGAASPGTLHWHVDFVTPHQKAELLNIIQKVGGTIDHESEELIIVSILKTEVEKTRAGIEAAGITLSEFGKLKPKENELRTIPVKISIYFTKR